MAGKTPKSHSNHRPVPWIVGTGLITLDIVIGASNPKKAIGHTAGGTCGNVLSTLAYLGWRAEPIALLGGDHAAAAILEDLKDSGVATTGIERQPGAETTRIVQKLIRTRDRHVRHRFLFSCPACGIRFPRHRPPTWKQYEAVTSQRELPDVFFFDRVSSTTLALAEWFKGHGTLIYFEPSSIGRFEEFKLAAEISDVVKYSDERLHAPLVQLGGLDKIATRLPRVEIETRGALGLRYRINTESGQGGRWTAQTAFRVAPFKDAAGAGDWCSSGFLYQLQWERGAGAKFLTRERVNQALAFGQALASLSCLYLGPRTAARAVHRQRLVSSAEAVQQHAETDGVPDSPGPAPRRIRAASTECSVCLGGSES